MNLRWCCVWVGGCVVGLEFVQFNWRKLQIAGHWTKPRRLSKVVAASAVIACLASPALASCAGGVAGTALAVLLLTDLPDGFPTGVNHGPLNFVVGDEIRFTFTSTGLGFGSVGVELTAAPAGVATGIVNTEFAPGTGTITFTVTVNGSYTFETFANTSVGSAPNAISTSTSVICTGTVGGGGGGPISTERKADTTDFHVDGFLPAIMSHRPEIMPRPGYQSRGPWFFPESDPEQITEREPISVSVDLVGGDHAATIGTRTIQSGPIDVQYRDPRIAALIENYKRLAGQIRFLRQELRLEEDALERALARLSATRDAEEAEQPEPATVEPTTDTSPDPDDQFDNTEFDGGPVVGGGEPLLDLTQDNDPVIGEMADDDFAGDPIIIIESEVALPDQPNNTEPNENGSADNTNLDNGFSGIVIGEGETSLDLTQDNDPNENGSADNTEFDGGPVVGGGEPLLDLPEGTGRLIGESADEQSVREFYERLDLPEGTGRLIGETADEQSVREANERIVELAIRIDTLQELLDPIVQELEGNGVDLESIEFQTIEQYEIPRQVDVQISEEILDTNHVDDPSTPVNIEDLGESPLLQFAPRQTHPSQAPFELLGLNRFDGSIGGVRSQLTFEGPVVDFWSRVRVSAIDGSQDLDGYTAHFEVGAVRHFTDDFYAGAFVSGFFGNVTSQATATTTAETDTTGIGIGAYGVTTIADNLTAGLSVFYDHSFNDVRIATSTGDYTRDLLTADASLTYSFLVHGFDMALTGNLNWTHVNRHGYTDSASTVVPGSTQNTVTSSLGLDVRRVFPIGGPYLLAVDTRAGALVNGHLVTQDDLTLPSGSTVSQSNVSGSVNLGLGALFRPGYRANVTLSANGLGGTSQSYGGSISVNVPIR